MQAKNCIERCLNMKETIRMSKANTPDMPAEIASALALFLGWLPCVGIELPLAGWAVGKRKRRNTINVSCHKSFDKYVGIDYNGL